MKAEIAAAIETVNKTLETIKRSVQFEEKQRELLQLSEQIDAPDLWEDAKNAQALLKKKATLQNVIDPIVRYQNDAEEARALLEMAEKEHDNTLIQECEAHILALLPILEKVRIASLLSGEADANDCYLEINSGAGGTEAQDWVAMLARMYTRWAERRKFAVHILDALPGEEAGFKSILLKIAGYQAYG